MTQYIVCCYAECHKEVLCAECRYAECRGAHHLTKSVSCLHPTHLISFHKKQLFGAENCHVDKTA